MHGLASLAHAQNGQEKVLLPSKQAPPKREKATKVQQQAAQLSPGSTEQTALVGQPEDAHQLRLRETALGDGDELEHLGSQRWRSLGNTSHGLLKSNTKHLLRGLAGQDGCDPFLAWVGGKRTRVTPPAPTGISGLAIASPTTTVNMERPPLPPRC